MKISELEKRLQDIKASHGDLDVLRIESSSGDPYPLGGVYVEIAEKDEYPADYEMPEGFTYVRLGSW